MNRTFYRDGAGKAGEEPEEEGCWLELQEPAPDYLDANPPYGRCDGV